jgi:uncharacterized membrane protein
MIHNHWNSIAHHDSPTLSQDSTPWFTTTGTEYHTMIHHHWHSITHHDLQYLAQHCIPWFISLAEHNTPCQWLWIMVCYPVTMLVNNGVLCCSSGCESWCAMLSPVVVNQGELLCTSGGESWCSMLRQCLWIMVYFAEPVVVNDGVLCCASGSKLWCAIWNSIAHHDSPTLEQNITPWFTTTVTW